MHPPPRVALIIESSGIYGRRILNGVARYLRSHHRWSVFLEQHALGVRPPAWLFSSKWDGILSRPTDPELAQLFQRMSLPVVDMNDLHEDLGLPWVGSNHRGIGEMGASHLLERGFRHFAFAGFAGELWAARRREGFCASAEAQGFEVSVYESTWRGMDAPSWDKDLEDIVIWLQGLPQPLGLMSCNDVRGLHVLDACARLGLLVPEQVAVVGVDDEEVLCELCTPALSSVQPNAEQIGYGAAELLDHLMAGKSPKQKRISVNPIRVVARRSTEALAIEDKVVAAAMRFIHDQALFGCSVSDVVQQVKVSRSVLERRFREHLKRSPQEEIRAVRLNRVKQLLTDTNFTLERIAELSGFDHPEYLNVMFKRLCGLNPGQYRRKHRK